MPVVELHPIEGYSTDEKRRLGEALTGAVRFVLPAQHEGIVIMMHEMKSDGYYRGGGTKTPAPALPDPSALVQEFLARVQARDLDRAQTMLAEDFKMQLPGAPAMSKLAELVAWAKPRYRFVEKSYEGIEALQTAGPESVVFARGKLSGEWPDGTPFSGIRFIDRFEVVEGKLTRQDVWNDLAEVRAR
ncbi:MAG: nuclear transport factor 2 family protein [Rhodobacteraceae bacterium]|nr:nuclear transport factor 2 family protein [Paracoccaceae bacterium]